jgi:valyl-tRNA synthetase
MPFITEEIYHLLDDHENDLTVKQTDKTGDVKQEILEQGHVLKEVITAIRDAKNKNRIKPKDKIKLHIQSDNKEIFEGIENILYKQINAESVSFTSDIITNSITVVVNKNKFYIETEKEYDPGSQKEQLLKDLEHLKGFLNSVEKKLSNGKFVQNANPGILALERKKKEDTETKIKVIEESLALIN